MKILRLGFLGRMKDEWKIGKKMKEAMFGKCEVVCTEYGER